MESLKGHVKKGKHRTGKQRKENVAFPEMFCSLEIISYPRSIISREQGICPCHVVVLFIYTSLWGLCSSQSQVIDCTIPGRSSSYSHVLTFHG